MTYTIENKGQKTIDLLITEFKMPERSGIDVIQEITQFLQTRSDDQG